MPRFKKILRKNEYVRAEYLVLSRIVYRMKQKFRNAKDFKSLEKLCKALHRFFNVNLGRDIQYFLNVIPIKYTEETYLPSKNLLDYILVRLQGTAKLMETIVGASKLTADLFDRRLRTGEFWKIAFMLFSLVSRIYVIGKQLINQISEYYELLLPFSDKLKNVGKKWLPDNYNFPKDLKMWLNVDWLDLEKEVDEIEKQKTPPTMQYFSLLKLDKKTFNKFEENITVEVKDFIDKGNEENIEIEDFGEEIEQDKYTNEILNTDVIFVPSNIEESKNYTVGEIIQENANYSKSEKQSILEKNLKEDSKLKKPKKKERNKKRKFKKINTIQNYP